MPTDDEEIIRSRKTLAELLERSAVTASDYRIAAQAWLDAGAPDKYDEMWRKADEIAFGDVEFGG